MDQKFFVTLGLSIKWVEIWNDLFGNILLLHRKNFRKIVISLPPETHANVKECQHF